MNSGGEFYMLEYFRQWLADENTKIYYFLGLIAIANMLDFLMGWLNAKFNKHVVFSSSKAIFGIARKLGMLVLLVVFVPVSLIIPEPIGMSALYGLYGGYLFSELNSILSHMKFADDDKSTDRFADFINAVFRQGGNKK